MKYAQRAKELDPNNILVEDTLGWVLCRKGLYRTAIKYLEHADTEGPTALGKYHLAIAYLKSGDRRRGLSVLAQARKLDPSLPESAAAQELVKAASKAN